MSKLTYFILLCISSVTFNKKFHALIFLNRKIKIHFYAQVVKTKTKKINKGYSTSLTHLPGLLEGTLASLLAWLNTFFTCPLQDGVTSLNLISQFCSDVRNEVDNIRNKMKMTTILFLSGVLYA